MKRRSTPDQVRKVVQYNPDTGELYWLFDTPSRGRRKGDIADRPSKTGRRFICLLNDNVQSTHAIWAIVYGKWPERYIDHINLNHADNRLCNLREATGSQNAANRVVSKRNPTGRKGVTLLPSGRFSAQIVVKCQPQWLGSFETADEASDAYKGAALLVFGEFAKI